VIAFILGAVTCEKQTIDDLLLTLSLPEKRKVKIRKQKKKTFCMMRKMRKLSGKKTLLKRIHLRTQLQRYNVDWETRTQTPVLVVTGECQILCDGRWTPLLIQATSYAIVALTFTNVSCSKSLLSLMNGSHKLMCSWGLEGLILAAPTLR